MKEQFCSYKLSRILDDLQFNKKCLAFYTEDKYFIFLDKPLRNSDLLKGFSSPLYSQVIDWLREKYNIQVLQICPIPQEAIKAAKGKLDNKKGYGFFLYNINWNPRIPNLDVWEEDFYKGREKAVLKAIELIEQNNEKNN